MEVAVEQYGFCPDLDQNEDGSIGSLADVLWQSTVWYFWWDWWEVRPMTEYQKTYIELKKQFVATNEGPDNVRAL